MQQHIERRIRRAFIGSLGLLRGRRADIGAIARLTAPRILLIRHDRIGDAIVSTPAMTLLRERFPDARIDLLLGAKNAAVAPILPAIDERIFLGVSRQTVFAAIRQIRRNRYDVAINLLVKDSASGALLTRLSGARLRIGFAGATSNVYDIAIEHPVTPMHIVRETSLLLAPLGIDAIGERPGRGAEMLSAAIPEEARSAARELTAGLIEAGGDRAAVLNISGSGPEKFWGVERFIACARALREGGMIPLIASAPADRERQEAIASGSGCAALPVSGSFAVFAAMLDGASVILTPDTSVVHLSAALGKPTAMLVGSAETGAVWGPWGVEHRVLSGRGGLGGIDPAAAAAAVLSLRAATRASFSSSTAS